MMRALVLAALALAVLAALLLAGNAWANARVWNARVEIRDEKIPAAFDGFVLCQVSDVHNEARGEGNAALLRALREAAPDLICITGDFLDSRRTDLDFALELAGQLAEIAPAVYVTGNHEARRMDLSALEAGLAARGVQVLRDDWTPLARGGEEIALLGLDDPGFAAGEDWTLAEGLDQTQARLSALLAQAGTGSPSCSRTGRSCCPPMRTRARTWCSPATRTAGRSACRGSAGSLRRGRGFCPG